MAPPQLPPTPRASKSVVKLNAAPPQALGLGGGVVGVAAASATGATKVLAAGVGAYEVSASTRAPAKLAPAIGEECECGGGVSGGGGGADKVGGEGLASASIPTS
jgi:hypothetical protein